MAALLESLGGRSPVDKWSECLEKIPSIDRVCAEYDPEKERFRLPNYKLGLELHNLK